MRKIVILLLIILTAVAFFSLGWFIKKPEKLPVADVEVPEIVNEEQRHADSIIDAEYPEYHVYGMHQEKDQQRQLIDHKYKFRFTIVAGCLVDNEIIASAEKQNKITDRIMTSRYGKNWLDKFENSVDSLYAIDSLAIEIARSDKRIGKIEARIKKYNAGIESQYSSSETPDDNIRMVTLMAVDPAIRERMFMSYFRAAVDVKRRRVVNLDVIPF